MPPTYNLDVRRLRQFAELATVGNFGRAATRLGIGQPTLSRAIRNLEQDLGVNLITRHSKGVVLTEQGERLRASASTIIRAFDNISELSSPAREDGVVVVGLPLSLGPQICDVLLKRFQEETTEASLQIVELTSIELQQAVIQGRVDAALIYDPPEIDGLVSKILLEESLVAAFPPMWNLSSVRGATMSLKTLANYPMILHSLAQSDRRVLLRAAQKYGLTFKPLLEVDNPATLKSLIRSGAACSVCSPHLVSEETKRGSIVTNVISDPVLKTKLHVSAPYESRTRPETLMATTLLRQTISQLLEEEAWDGATSLMFDQTTIRNPT